MWLSALYPSPSVPSGWRGLAIGLFVVDIKVQQPQFIYIFVYLDIYLCFFTFIYYTNTHFEFSFLVPCTLFTMCDSKMSLSLWACRLPLWPSPPQQSWTVDTPGLSESQLFTCPCLCFVLLISWNCFEGNPRQFYPTQGPAKYRNHEATPSLILLRVFGMLVAPCPAATVSPH
jgi:hypothetical protein